jgi:type II secretory pathway component PulF
MATFAYKGINIEGTLISGTFDAENTEAADVALASKDLTILSVARVSELSARLSFLSGGVKRRDVIEFTRNLATVLKAGISMLDGLGDIAQATEKKALRDTIYDIKDRILSGSTLSDALDANGQGRGRARRAHAFPDILVRMARIGEETGRLELSLTEVADHLQRLDDLSGTVKRALMYPVFVLVVIGGVLIFWLTYVMPKLISVVVDMGVKMPLATRIVIALSDALKSRWYLLPLVVLALVALLIVARKKESFRYYYDSVKLRLPIVRLFVFYRNLAAFSEQMSILTVAGITVDRSLTVVGDSMGSEVFKRALYRVRDRILAGSRISEAVREQTVFPKMVARLIDVGETTGNLSDQFAFIFDFYSKRLDDVSEKLGKLIEPIMMSVVGLIFVFMMIAILLPMYEVIGKFK